MKRLRNLLTVVMILAMILTLSVTALAASDGSVTIDNATVGETYKIYKVFDLTYSGVGETSTGAEGGDPLYSGVAYTYTKTSGPDNLYNALIGTGSPFTLTATTTPNVYQVTSTATATEISAWLKNNEGLLTEAATAVIATSATVKWTGLAYGYYYITSTVGSTVTIDSTLKDVTVKDKNTVPTLTKTVSDEAAGTYGADATIKIGDTAYFKIAVTDGAGTDKALVVHDTLPSGLTLNVGSFSIKVDGTDVDAAKYSIVTTGFVDGCTFEITFNDAYIASLGDGKVIEITYQAELNKDATIGATGNTNTAKLEYSAQTSTDVTATVKTYRQDIVKTDVSNKVLDGATFKLYDADTGGTVYEFVKTADGEYRVKESTDAPGDIVQELTTKDGLLKINGLENGTYYLEETASPAGYNKLTARQSFTITDANNEATITGDTYTTGGIQVVNQTGTELPSTGGIGTTIFYIIGGVLVVGAGVLLITKKRMKADED